MLIDSRILWEKKDKKKQVFEATENKSRWLFLQNNLVFKNNVESIRSNFLWIIIQIKKNICMVRDKAYN